MNKLDELITRANEKRSMPLYDFIMSEHLQSYQLGYEDILYADDLNNAVVPCREYLILTRERLDSDNNFVAEYAVYSQHDADNAPLCNSLNMNATYTLEFVGEETFENMAFAIAYAADLVRKMTDNDYDDPLDMLMNMTNPGEDWTIEDAGHILGEAIAQGWHFAPNVTAQLILDLYNDLEPEEE